MTENMVKNATSKDDVSKLVMLVENDFMRETENSPNINMLVENKTNITNITNTTNSTNITNTISILGIPESKVESIYFYLYENIEGTTEKLIEISGMPKNSFWNLTSKDQDIVVLRKEDKTAIYGISDQLREKITLRINQKLKVIKNEIRENEILKQDFKKNENILLEVKKILSDNFVSRIEKGFIFINLKELQELYLNIFNELIDNPEKMIELFKLGIEEKGFHLILRFDNYDIIKSRSIESLRSKDINMIHQIECRVSAQSDVRPQVISAKFECPSCGTMMSVLQIETKFREPSKCSCGRRGGFKEISKELIDRAKIEVEDITDLTETPQVRSKVCYAKEYLTEPQELSKLNPGSEVKILVILKSMNQNVTGIKTTTLETYFDILEVQPFESVIDLDSFSDEEIEEYNKLSLIIKENNNLDEPRGSFAPDIIGNEKPKDALILKLAQGRTRKNKSHMLMISNPGLAKSMLAKKYHSLMPNSSYTSGSGSSIVGLTASVEKRDDGWVCKPGVLVTTKEDAVIDEYNLMPEEERPKMQEAMSEGFITINKASIHTKLKSICGILANANPKNGVFDKTADLVSQFDIPPQILNRFDMIFILEDVTNTEADKKIARQMLLRNEDKIPQKYSDDFLKRFFLYIRSQKEPSFGEELINEYIPQKYSDIRKLMRLKNNNSVNA